MCDSHACGYPEKRWMQFLILRVVCEKPSHGYRIMQRIGEISEGRHHVKSGTMYTLLGRMEDACLLRSTWIENPGGPNKRIYSPTEKGKTYLKKWLEQVIERRKMMDKMTEFYNNYFGEGEK